MFQFIVIRWYKDHGVQKLNGEVLRRHYETPLPKKNKPNLRLNNSDNETQMHETRLLSDLEENVQ